MRDTIRLLTVRISTALLLLIVSAACNWNTGGETFNDFVSGTVVDAATSQPIDSAWAALSDTLLEGSKWYTDSLGVFSLPNVGTAPRLVLHVGKDGYLTIADTFQYVADTSGLYYELEQASGE